MSTITELIARDHLPTHTMGCTCGGVPLGRSYVEHVAAVAVAAAGEAIASEILDYWDACGVLIDSHNGARLAVEALAEIARTAR